MTRLQSAWMASPEFAWETLPPLGKPRTLRQHETLFHQGDRAEWAYFVVSGRVRLSIIAPDGRERQLMIIGSSSIVGERLGQEPTHAVCAYAATATCVVRAFSNDALRETAYRQPSLMEKLLLLQERKFLLMLTHLELQNSHSAMQRVIHHLLGLANSYGQSLSEGIVINLAFTKQEMANLCGLSRVSVANVFSKLEENGILGKSGRLVLIKKFQWLQDQMKETDSTKF